MGKLKNCSLKGCKTISGKGKSFFRCPTDKVLSEKWINFRKTIEKCEIIKIVKSFELCEDHFNSSDLVPFGKLKRLKHDSVPIYKDIQVN